MSNIRILFNPWSQGLTITATSEAMAASNLHTYQPKEVWRSTTDADQTLSLFSAAASENTNCCVLYNHNLTDAGTVQIQGSNDAGFSPLLFDQTYDALDSDLEFEDFDQTYPIGTQYNSFVAYFTLTDAKYWRAILSDGANPLNYMQAGRLMFGQYWEPSKNLEWGYSLDWVDPSAVIRTRGGSLINTTKTPYRKASIKLRFLTTAEAEKALDMKRLSGRRNDLFLSVYPGEGSTRERRNSMLGFATEWAPTIHTAHEFYSQSFSIEESI